MILQNNFNLKLAVSTHRRTDVLVRSFKAVYTGPIHNLTSSLTVFKLKIMRYNPSSVYENYEFLGFFYFLYFEIPPIYEIVTLDRYYCKIFTVNFIPSQWALI